MYNHSHVLCFPNSVTWIFDGDKPPVVKWMGKSVIRSCSKLSYNHALSVISGRFDDPFPQLDGEHSLAEVHKNILKLNEFAVALRKQRFIAGSIEMNLPKLCFELDKITGKPINVHTYPTTAANSLIEEFMLLANIAVAEKLNSSFPGN